MLRLKAILFNLVCVAGFLFATYTPVTAADTLSVYESGVTELTDHNSDESVTVRVATTGAQRGNRSTAVETIGALEDILIPIVAITIPFLCVFLIVFFTLRYQIMKRKQKYAILEKALELGRDLPKEFFIEEKPAPKSGIEQALILVAAGIGLAFLAFFMHIRLIYGVGAICFFVGIAKLVVWKLEQKSQDSFSNQDNE